MHFPAFVRTPLETVELDGLAQAQGINECGVTTPANALTLLHRGAQQFSKDMLRHEAGWWFWRSWGGSPSFVTGWLLKRHGAGTHFGAVARARGGDALLRDLLDRGLYVCIELGRNTVGPVTLYGAHSVLLVGYSQGQDERGVLREEYYILDAARTNGAGQLDLVANDQDRDGDGVKEVYPGNRTLALEEFWGQYPTGIYFPVFPSQAEHDHWYAGHVRKARHPLLWRQLMDHAVSGTHDTWLG